MRSIIALSIVLLAGQVHAAEVDAKASARLDGKRMQFPEKGVAGGVEATMALLASCHHRIEGSAEDLKKAQAGDHVRLVFASPVSVTVLGEKLAVTELVMTQPLNTGVFWLRSGEKVIRCAKYEFAKEKAFVAWRDEAQVAE